MTDQQQTRSRIAQAVKKWLEDNNLYCHHSYDCGELGVLRIFWRANEGWWFTWIEPDPLPVEIQELLDDQL